MKSAILYIRVSTDEQADKGYSQRNQDEVLQRYCAARSISVRCIIYEDHSAKTFNRPAWKEMLRNLKKQKSKSLPDYILFTKWDRFSRNTSDAYQMIAFLNSLKVEPQAVEQPIDLSVPENKMMLAFYLAVPEVENDRRGLNIFYGIRRARKEGRWMGHAPVGYQNTTTETGRKYIRLNIPQARLMKQAFEELATGKFSIEQVWKKARSNGLHSQCTNFATAIRNPLYCGKIIVPAFQDEPAQIVTGQHEALISEELFAKVQQAINRKKMPQKTKISDHTYFPLRGFLKCNRCNRMLTASASKGRNSHYYYYHCSTSCGIRYKAPTVNHQFIASLSKFNAAKGFKTLFKEIARDLLRIRNQTATKNRDLQNKNIHSLTERLVKIREMLVDEKIESADYQALKRETEDKIKRLQAQLELSVDPEITITKLLNRHSPGFLKLDALYQSATVADQRKLYMVIFAGNTEFDGESLTNSAVFPVVKLIFKES